MFPNKEETSKMTNDESKTILGSNALFKGELTFKGILAIDGKFEGQLTTDDTLIVAEQGDVLADVKAGTLICKGRIKGDIVASQKVEMNSTGKIIGNMQTPALSIELGAVFEGKCDMSCAENPPSEDGSKPNEKVVTIK